MSARSALRICKRPGRGLSSVTDEYFASIWCPAVDFQGRRACFAGCDVPGAHPLASGFGRAAVRNLFRPSVARYLYPVYRLARRTDACRVAVLHRKTNGGSPGCFRVETVPRSAARILSLSTTRPL